MVFDMAQNVWPRAAQTGLFNPRNGRTKILLAVDGSNYNKTKASQEAYQTSLGASGARSTPLSRATYSGSMGI